MGQVPGDTIRKFNRDTFWLATGVLGTVICATLVLAAQEHQPTPTQADRDRLLDANPARVSSVIAIGANANGEMSSESGVDHEFVDNRLQEISSSQVESSPSTSATVLTSTPVELFRYRGAAKDGGTLEYVFEGGDQNSPNAISKEKVAEIAADFMTTFYHEQVGALETQEFRTTPVPFWLVCFRTRLKLQSRICTLSFCCQMGR
jgi:hypothetical protein